MSKLFPPEMTDRFRDLASTAGIRFTDYGSGEFIDDGGCTPSSLQEFAELIVRECARLPFKDTMEVTTDGELAVSDMILRHFGVES
jgi:hypothetical protein